MNALSLLLLLRWWRTLSTIHTTTSYSRHVQPPFDFSEQLLGGLVVDIHATKRNDVVEVRINKYMKRNDGSAYEKHEKRE